MDIAIGSIVCVTVAGEQRIGEVVGVRSVAGTPLFDVTCEQAVMRSRMADEIHLASEAEVMALLSYYAMDARSSDEAEDSDPHVLRDQLLAQEYATWLAQVLQSMRAGEGSAPSADAAAYVTGEIICVREGTSWCLGRVESAQQRAEGIRYRVVRAEDEDTLSCPESDLTTIEELKERFGALAPGSRARLAIAGEEDNPDFEGTICRISECEGGPLFSLIFDDGDVFCEQTEDDLVPLS